jgi:hypothetical protein
MCNQPSCYSGEVKTQNTSQAWEYSYVELSYLAGHLAEFENLTVTTNGTVRFYGSIYMFEDFWLQAPNDAKIPIVTRFAGLSVPWNGSLIEIFGRIEHSNLEGGFYFLNASFWRDASAIPEFPNIVVLFVVLFVFSVLATVLTGDLRRDRLEHNFFRICQLREENSSPKA